MSNPRKSNHLPEKRRRMYDSGDYNPYSFLPSERPLVEENLQRLHAGDIPLRKFLKQTPHFARWQDEQIAQARILLVINEPRLIGIEKLYAEVVKARSAKEVADHFRTAMLSWLCLTDHPGLEEINGEAPWVENGPWQEEFPRLAACGKAGYFIVPGEEEIFADSKVLHMELSPFPQESGQEANPRNDQDIEYHRANIETLRKFIALATPQEPRWIFIIGNRASVRATGANAYRLEAIKSPRKDHSGKIGGFLQVAQGMGREVSVRISRRWPLQGVDAEVLEVVRAVEFELRRVGEGRAFIAQRKD